MDDYRSYVINYNLGKDLVQQYVEAHGGGAAQPAKRWDIFGELLRSPRLPSGLRSDRLALPSRRRDLRAGSRGRGRARQGSGPRARAGHPRGGQRAGSRAGGAPAAAVAGGALQRSAFIRTMPAPTAPTPGKAAEVVRAQVDAHAGGARRWRNRTRLPLRLLAARCAAGRLPRAGAAGAASSGCRS